MIKQSTHQLAALTFILIFLTGVSCENITNPSSGLPSQGWQDIPEIAEADDGSLSDSIKAEYRMSAEELAIQLVIESDSSQIEIPGNLILNLYNGLIHIVNSGLEEAKDVTTEYQIQARPQFARGEILVTVDTTGADWLDSWRNGNVETGVEQIDQLITTYNMHLKSYSELNSMSWAMAVLKTSQQINPLPLAEQFADIPSVSGSELNYMAGDGHAIKVDVAPGAILYRFEYAWGDCPAGCINRHFWEFSVDKNGDVQFLDEGGHALPAS